MSSQGEDISLNMDAHWQVDLILLDFSKAFNIVLHYHLLTKLKIFQINGQVVDWITKWLSYISKAAFIRR